MTVVAGALAAFSLGLVFNGWMLMLTRGFYALQSNWIPTTVAVGTLLLNAGLDVALYRVGVWGIPLATSLVNVAGATVLVVLLARRGVPLALPLVGRSIGLVAIASAAAAAAAFGLWWVLDDALGRSLLAQLVAVGAALAAAAAVYLAACRALGVAEVQALRALGRGRSGD